MNSREYADWFGAGDTNEDVKEAIKEHGAPDRVFFQSDGFMAALVYPDKVICIGYDGNEYWHNFEMTEADDSLTKVRPFSLIGLLRQRLKAGMCKSIQ